MSLDWNLTEIENREELCWTIAEVDSPARGITKGDKILNPLTEGLIFATIVVGMGQLDKEGLDEFFARVSLYEKVNGAFMQEVSKEGEYRDRPFTLDDLKAHVGLRTNVTYEPRSEWLERILQRHFPTLEPAHNYYLVEFIWDDDELEMEVAGASPADAVRKARTQLAAMDTGYKVDRAQTYVDGEKVAA